MITYNFLNLPEIVTRPGDKQLQYIYDAGGRKLRQEVTSNTTLEKATDYAGEYIYENDTLRFINHEEGRIIPVSLSPVEDWEYQYHLKDHLGNVRMTFTSKHAVDTAVATMETANASEEQAEFLYYNEAVKINATIFDHTNSGATHYATRLTGVPNHQYGLAKSISVMAGDTIRATVFAKYLERDTTLWDNGNGLATLMNTVRWSTPAAGVLIDGGTAGTTGGVTPPYAALLAKGQGTQTGAPKAYLNFLVFDRDFHLLDGGFVGVSTAAREYGQDGLHEQLSKQLIIKKAGYVYLYLSNDNAALGGNAIEVFFDDFTVQHVKSPVVQQDDYYPFGAIFNSYSREYSVRNKRLYQTKEYQEDLDLNLFDFGGRQYDPWVVFTTTQDPLAEEFYSYSPYSWAVGNPMRFIDPSGMAAMDITLLGANNSSITIETDLVEISVDASGLGIDFGGNYSFGGNDIVHAALDIAGVVDPSGVADAANAALYASEGGSWGDVFISGLGVIPYAGDLAKAGRLGKAFSKINDAIKMADKANDARRSSKTADVVTYAGQKIDPKTGQKIGGSGKARSITVDHGGQKKRAKDAARQGGKGTPVKHTKDKKGGKHYHHGNGKKGKGKGTKGYGKNSGKKSDNVHHQYN